MAANTTKEAFEFKPITKTRTLILFGVDKEKKPRAAWFDEEELGLLAKAAEAMSLTMLDVNTPQSVDLAKKLPAGRLHAAGTAFVPNVKQQLYDEVVALAGKDAVPATPPIQPGFPASFDKITPGHLVIAQETLEYGWWEAIVLNREGDMLTLRYRDFPRMPKFVRHRSAVALIGAPAQ
jgi:hypothetical protein